jgi:hypothetical protein
LPQIVPGLPGVRELARPEQQEVVSNVQFVQEIGGLTGRFALAYLVVLIVSRRKLLRLFLVPGMLLVPFVFAYPAVNDLTMLKVGIFVAGFLTVAQFSFWGNYLPRVYPLHLRGTGESFAANIGGRIFGTAFAWVTITIAGSAWIKEQLPDATPAQHFAYTAAAVALFVYVANNIMCFFLPEPEQEALPEYHYER